MNIDILLVKEKIEKLIEEWNVPGICIGIIDAYGNKDTISFGERDIEKGKQFNENTIMPIGCCTKAFTSMALGVLVDKEKISFNDPIKKHYKDFKLSSQLLTENVSIKDILCMRTGIQMNEIVYKKTNYTYENILDKAKYLSPQEGFREFFLYDVFLYNYLKKVIINVTGLSWEKFVINEIINPIGMNDLNFGFEYLDHENYAKGYHQNNEELTEDNRHFNINCIMPSAGINITMKEILKWMQFILCGGRYNNIQVISNSSFNDIFKPYSFSKAKPVYNELLYQSYALGWFNEPYKGNNTFYHEGNPRGFSSLISIMPELKIGISVLINKDKCPLTRVILYYIIDSLLGIEPTNWSKRFMRELIMKRNKINYVNEHTLPLEIEDINGNCFFNKVYGILKIYWINRKTMTLNIFDIEYSFYSIMDEWIVFKNNGDNLFFKYIKPSNDINIKFSTNSKEVIFTKYEEI